MGLTRNVDGSVFMTNKRLPLVGDAVIEVVRGQLFVGDLLSLAADELTYLYLSEPTLQLPLSDHALGRKGTFSKGTPTVVILNPPDLTAKIDAAIASPFHRFLNSCCFHDCLLFLVGSSGMPLLGGTRTIRSWGGLSGALRGNGSRVGLRDGSLTTSRSSGLLLLIFLIPSLKLFFDVRFDVLQLLSARRQHVC